MRTPWGWWRGRKVRRMRRAFGGVLTLNEVRRLEGLTALADIGQPAAEAAPQPTCFLLYGGDMERPKDVAFIEGGVLSEALEPDQHRAVMDLIARPTTCPVLEQLVEEELVRQLAEMLCPLVAAALEEP